MRILILEDDPLIGLDLLAIVEGCGHKVIGVCSSVAAARERLDEHPDFCFLDVDLPDGKSYEIAARLDEEHVPFAFVSGSRPAEVPERLRHARFIPKPYADSAIRSTLQGDAPRRLAS